MYVFVKRGKLNVTAVLYVLKAAIWIWRFDAMYKQSMNVVKGVGLGIAAGAARGCRFVRDDERREEIRQGAHKRDAPQHRQGRAHGGAAY